MSNNTFMVAIGRRNLLFMASVLPILLLFTVECLLPSHASQLRASSSSTERGGKNRFAVPLGDSRQISEIVSKKDGVTTRQLSNQQDGKQLTSRSFPECIEQNLSPAECQVFIQDTIDNAGGHELGDINMKIRNPRTPDEFNDSYWMAEVTVDINGDVTCSNYDIEYPFQWQDGTTNTGINIDAITCVKPLEGISGGECCYNILEYGRSLTATGYDANGQCLTCFVHQEPLSPVVNIRTGAIDYQQCVTEVNLERGFITLRGVQFTSRLVDELDALKSTKYALAYDLLHDVMNALDRIAKGEEVSPISNPCLNGQSKEMLIALWDAAATIPPLSQLVGQLACRVCYGRELDVVDWTKNDKISELVATISKILQNYSPPSSRNICLTIHTTSDGDIAKVPGLTPLIQNAQLTPCGPDNPDGSCEEIGFSCQDSKCQEDLNFLQAGDECFEIGKICDPASLYCDFGPPLGLGCYIVGDVPVSFQGTCEPYTTCTAQTDCNVSEEFCDPLGRCRNRLKRSTCCDGTSNYETFDINVDLCGLDDDTLRPMKCVVSVDKERQSEYRCELPCETDDDCNGSSDSSSTTLRRRCAFLSESTLGIKQEFGVCLTKEQLAPVCMYDNMYCE